MIYSHEVETDVHGCAWREPWRSPIPEEAKWYSSGNQRYFRSDTGIGWCAPQRVPVS